MPHSGRPPKDLVATCQSLVDLVGPVAGMGLPVVMLGDVNTDLHAAKKNARPLQVCSAVELMGVTLLEPCSCPTWRTKCYDYIMCNPEFASRTAAADPAHQYWSCHHVRYDVQGAHGVDHALVSSESLVCGMVHESKGSCYSGRPAKMMVCQTRHRLMRSLFPCLQRLASSCCASAVAFIICAASKQAPFQSGIF